MRVWLKLAAFATVALALGAVVWCAAAPCPALARIPWMPDWLGKWADAHPTFRNFPAFAVLAFVFCVFGAVFFRRIPPVVLASLSGLASSFVAVGLECFQLTLPGRFFDSADILWSLAGAFAGAVLPVAPWCLSACLRPRRCSIKT
jgi:hypothetical protein